MHTLLKVVIELLHGVCIYWRNMFGTAIAQRLYMELLDIRLDRAMIYFFTHELIVLAIKGVETDAKREPKES